MHHYTPPSPPKTIRFRWSRLSKKETFNIRSDPNFSDIQNSRFGKVPRYEGQIRPYPNTNFESTIPFKHVPTPFVQHKCLEESIVKLALTLISFRAIASQAMRSLSAQDPCQPDPSQPKIPVNPRSPSAQDPVSPE